MAATIAPTAVAEPQFDPDAVDRYVREYADNAAYPGVAVAITRGDRVVHLAGYGHTSTGAVRGHVSAIVTRLDLANRVQPAVLAHDAGLVARPP
ncbi:hypothetical protein [Saccharothrix violaceirubra]|uniref:CubicO group peptidase (Beta-lactamase class C family) n=1 Tax=Saccharothrix violaceirubra TaxID=413306 RepID=A0A7W7WW47_9PSEU|nr:hypothetical protein [Saccharothrix violaceirubra]MBB4965731.1 CubicO group peptidase (beta-lactamase class C family) [Saccharothrix violaceirubra]